MLGQYLGPIPSISPLYIADLWRFSRTICAVASVVWVIQQETWFEPGAQPILDSPDCSTWNKSSGSRVSWKAKKVGSASPFCSRILLKSMLLPNIRGGVPVFSRLSSMPVSTKIYVQVGPAADHSAFLVNEPGDRCLE